MSRYVCRSESANAWKIEGWTSPFAPTIEGKWDGGREWLHSCIGDPDDGIGGVLGLSVSHPEQTKEVVEDAYRLVERLAIETGRKPSWPEKPPELDSANARVAVASLLQWMEQYDSMTYIALKESNDTLSRTAAHQAKILAAMRSAHQLQDQLLALHELNEDDK